MFSPEFLAELCPVKQNEFKITHYTAWVLCKNKDVLHANVNVRLTWHEKYLTLKCILFLLPAKATVKKKKKFSLSLSTKIT